MEFRVLGPLEVVADRGPLPLGGTKQRSVLAALLLSPNQVVSVDRLVDDLWGDDPPERPVATLQVYVSNLRKLLEPHRRRGTPGALLVSRPPGYVLEVTAEQVDSLRFDALVAEARRQLATGALAVAGAQLRQALGLWRGSAFADLACDFVARGAARMEEARLAALEDRLDVDLALGRHAELVGELESMVAEQPLRERRRSQLMLALYRCGRQAEALKAYRDARETLVEELGIEPGPALQRLEQAILVQDPALDLVAEPVATVERPAPGPGRRDRGQRSPLAPVNLPVPLTSFVGLEHEAAELAGLVIGNPLVTVSGPGGSGKSRLAVRVAWDLVPDFPGGIWLVDLGAVDDPGLVPQVTADTLGLGGGDAGPLDALRSHVEARRALLVLDNCEHLVDAVARLAEALLQVSGELRVLATSRELLGLGGEVVWRLRSLGVPPEGADPERVAASEAGELFVDRARRAQPSFGLSGDNAASVAELCRRLDGIPLAIELAAAGLRALSVQQLAGRLGDRFRLLTHGNRSALPRQQTLRAAIDWSYDLLSEDERGVLASLSVFAGGCDLDAAEAVCGAGGEAGDALQALLGLVDKSLVVVDRRGGEVRYRLLETVQEYARERLAARGTGPEVAARHRDWYAGLAQRAEAALTGPDRDRWLDALEEEHDNLRAVLGRALGGGEASLAQRVAAALATFWLRHGHLREGRDWLERALAAAPADGSPDRARALAAAAALAFEQGDWDRAGLLGAAASGAFERLGDGVGVAAATAHLGAVARAQGDLALAERLTAGALVMLEEQGDAAGAAAVRCQLGTIARLRGDHATARRHLEEALASYEGPSSTVGSDPSHAPAAAAAFHARQRSQVLSELALVAGEEGDLPRAAALLEQSLGLARGPGNKVGTAQCLEGLARLAAAAEPGRAAALFGAAAGLREEIGAALTPQDQAEHDRFVLDVTRRLGAGPAATAEARGRAMPLEEAVRFAVSKDAEP